MKRNVLLDIILDFHEGNIPYNIKRNIDITIPTVNKAVAIIGPRRAGKTFRVYNFISELLHDGIPKDQILFINLDDDRLLPLTLEDMDLILNAYYELYPKNKEKKVYLILDEIQNVPNWEKYVRRIMDNENIQVLITGSSSKLLSKEIATSMRGRAISYTVLPFSFREYLALKQFPFKEHLSSKKRAEILSLLSEYQKFGAYPEIVLENSSDIKVKILREYVDVMLIRDVIERYKVRNIKILRTLYDNLIASTGSIFSTNKFHKFLINKGLKASKNTIYQYKSHLVDAYAVIILRRFDFSLRKIEQSLPKIYPIDPGLLLIHSTRFSENKGKSMETTVAIELLRKKEQNPLTEIYYWRDVTQKEVDFLIKQENKITDLIQVSYTMDDYATREREIKALIRASDDLTCNSLWIITWDYEDMLHIENKQIKCIPLWKWLIESRN